MKRHVLEISTRGCTNMEAGLRLGSELLAPYDRENPEDVENRVIFLTDAMPNLCETGEDGLLAMTEAQSRLRRHLTFIGIGVDFNSSLVKGITRIRGANYFSVHSAAEFKRRLDDEFELMVTPLVFDLALEVQAGGLVIERVYGSPEARNATGRVMYVNTLFPSKCDEKGARGGIILLKVRERDEMNAEIGTTSGFQEACILTAAYEDRSGRRHAARTTVAFLAPTVSGGQGDSYDSPGIRKGILLARYGDLIHDWIAHERGVRPSSPDDDWQANGLNPWERTSQGLRVCPRHRDQFRQFRQILDREQVALADATLAQESAILARLAGEPSQGE